MPETALQLVSRFKRTLSSFVELEDKYYSSLLAENEKYINQFIEMLKGVREKQRKKTEEINILDILGFTYDEMKHSKFLAWLLDPTETHAQKDLFFSIFIREKRLPVEILDGPDFCVKKEVSGDESRIDIEIIRKTMNRFIIHIENKVGMKPTKEQLKREEVDLIKRAESFGINEKRRWGFLLSKENATDVVEGTMFSWVGWDTMVRCLNDFARMAEAEKTKWVAEQYKECIENNIIRINKSIKEDRDEENERT